MACAVALESRKLMDNDHVKARLVAVGCAAGAVLLAAGCSDPPAPPPADVVRPVMIQTVGESEISSGLRFPGRVRATERAELSFNVSGELVELPVEEGRTVAAGELIAALDPEPFEIRLAAARAEFEKAQTDFERVSQIWERTQAVARAEVDQKRTAMEVARSRFAAERKEFEDSKLTAPFDGVIARRYVENFRSVQAKEPIVSLQDLSELEIVIHVPERLVQTAPRRVAARVRFDALPGRTFPVALESFSSEADPQTQTYEVVLSMTRPQDANILPGMAAEVLPEAADGEDNQVVTVPVEAMFAGSDGESYVWVVDPDSGEVSRRAIDVGELTADGATVLAGLDPGERIVTAGVHQLRDSMRVRPL
jgi:RND family efflux transporter MFP subunit